MKIVHIESGLGNQMLSYCELLAILHASKDESCYIETITYDIPDVKEFVNQWNGYELYDIFKITTPNVRGLFDDDEWHAILQYIIDSKFWEKNWNWPVYFTKAFSKAGLELHNLRGDFEKDCIESKKTFMGYLRRNGIYKRIQQTKMHAILRKYRPKSVSYKKGNPEALFYAGSEDALCGQRLDFMYKGNGIERIDSEIRETFTFPEIIDTQNAKVLDMIKGVQAVAIHIRRGDMLSLNKRYFQSGYYKRAVKFIKKKVPDPVFFVFCEKDGVNWCKDNGRLIGVEGNDKVFYVGFNDGKTSFRDMQLMSMCKHNIISISSFGWWGAYLNSYKHKITISPEEYINTTHNF